MRIFLWGIAVFAICSFPSMTKAGGDEWSNANVLYEVIDHDFADRGMRSESTLILVLTGEVAKKMYAKLPVEPIHDECLEKGEVKFHKGIYCRADSGEYECRIGVGLNSATIKPAFSC